MIWGFLSQSEPELQINGSSVSFKKTGDIEVKTGRHWLQSSKLVLINSPEEFKNRAIHYYALGSKVFQRFNTLEMLKNLFSEAEQKAKTIKETELLFITEEKLQRLKLEIALLSQSLEKTERLTPEEDAYIEQRLRQIGTLLMQFRQNVKLFASSTEEALITHLEKIPGLTVSKIEKISDTSNTSEVITATIES